MKHQAPHLDTLPRVPIRMFRILKCSVGHPPRPSIQLAIIALNQHHLLRRLPILVIPRMLLIRSHAQRLTPSIRVDETDGYKVAFRNGAGVSYSEGVLVDGLDGTPDIDDLVAVGEKVFCLGGEMVRDSVAGGGIGLINMNTLHGATEVGGVAGVDGGAADCVVEDEDAGGSSSEVSLVDRSGYRMRLHTHLSGVAPSLGNTLL
jgi:hypothetical protein